MMNKLVNITRSGGFASRTKYDVYIGRLSNQQRLEGVYDYGNPFTVAKFGRPLAILLYHVWFDYKIKHDRDFRQAIYRLNGLVLGCFCKPYDCHGNAIIKYLESL